IAGLYAAIRLFALDFRPPGGAYHPSAGLNFIKNYLFLMVGSLVRLDFMELLHHWRIFQSNGSYAELFSYLLGKPFYLMALLLIPLLYLVAYLRNPPGRFFILWGIIAFLPVAFFPGSGERLLYFPLTGLLTLVPIPIHYLSTKLKQKNLSYLFSFIWLGYLFWIQQSTLKNWMFASEITKKTVEIIGQMAQTTGRPMTVCVDQAPDHYQGAWVLRMGFEQLGGLFYPEGLVETKLRSERDCPDDSTRLLFFGEFQGYQLVLKPAN
ncbi:MAG: hypothetical protein ACRECJ_06385, partial [Limisphaerales bacterium]